MDKRQPSLYQIIHLSHSDFDLNDLIDVQIQWLNTHPVSVKYTSYFLHHTMPVHSNLEHFAKYSHTLQIDRFLHHHPYPQSTFHKLNKNHPTSNPHLESQSHFLLITFYSQTSKLVNFHMEVHIDDHNVVEKYRFLLKSASVCINVSNGSNIPTLAYVERSSLKTMNTSGNLPSKASFEIQSE